VVRRVGENHGRLFYKMPQLRNLELMVSFVLKTDVEYLMLVLCTSPFETVHEFAKQPQREEWYAEAMQPMYFLQNLTLW
jgi:hypothetical protein